VKQHPLLRTFHARPEIQRDPEVAAEQAEQERDRFFEMLHRTYEMGFGFMNGLEDPINDPPEEFGPAAYAITYPMADENNPRFLKSILLFLQLEIMDALLIDKASNTDSEKMGCQWFMANTLAHELMVGEHLLFNFCFISRGILLRL
jgi:hypothetical protein